MTKLSLKLSRRLRANWLCADTEDYVNEFGKLTLCADMVRKCLKTDVIPPNINVTVSLTAPKKKGSRKVFVKLGAADCFDADSWKYASRIQIPFSSYGMYRIAYDGLVKLFIENNIPISNNYVPVWVRVESLGWGA